MISLRKIADIADFAEEQNLASEYTQFEVVFKAIPGGGVYCGTHTCYLRHKDGSFDHSGDVFEYVKWKLARSNEIWEPQNDEVSANINFEEVSWETVAEVIHPDAKVSEVKPQGLANIVCKDVVAVFRDSK